MSIEHQLTLNYQLQTGWLEPFIRGLQHGVATARVCSACRKTTFPPIRVCECNHTEAEWISLSGTARIVHRCDGSEGSHALVQFEGADTHTVVRLDDIVETDSVGFLKACGTDGVTNTPALIITRRPQDSTP